MIFLNGKFDFFTTGINEIAAAENYVIDCVSCPRPNAMGEGEVGLQSFLRLTTIPSAMQFETATMHLNLFFLLLNIKSLILSLVVYIVYLLIHLLRISWEISLA